GMFSYVGWNLFGSSVGVFKNQIVNILLNQFFGSLANAARAIASQVSAAVTSFSQNFSTAIRPQIIKTYAAEQKEECLSLTFRGCRMTFFLMYIFTLPLALEMPFVLDVWLKNPPENAVIFARLVLIDALVDSVSYPIMTLAQATGKIKLYQSVVGGILLMNLPASYVCLKCGLPAYSVLVVAICITFIAFVVRLFIIKALTDFSIRSFLMSVCLPIFAVAVLSAVVPVAARYFIKDKILNFICVVFLSVAFTSVSVLFVGMNKSERVSVLNMMRRRIFNA
ncbi:lipopolysaccharide biosynthesis protein, partial [Treponema sp. UBA6852]|uniref:lipopolysaccharide biosynthesis protein n=1 Tax=Treponema sp. UBA6852 TaxID=1947744 RepID=UPI0039C8E153